MKLLIILVIVLSLYLKIKKNSKNKTSFISTFSYNITSNNNSIQPKEHTKANISFNNYNKNKTYKNIKEYQKTNIFHFTINNIIYQLIKDSDIRQPKYLLFFDFFYNPYCNDINSYLLLEYYFNKKNETNAYYFTNSENDLYKALLKKNQTKNIIPIDNYMQTFDVIYPYLLNSKIIVCSYVDIPIQKVVSKVNYLKYLYITHAIGYFKTKIIAEQFFNLREDKRNIIVSSPYEYDLYKNKLKYKEKYMYKAGLPRYDLLNSIQRNISENKCILITFTYRKYSNEFYEKSLYKKNLEILLNDTSLISFLKRKNIDLIYIQHHFDFLRKRPFNPNNFNYVKYRNQSSLFHYIEQCSLLITDFSTISFDFMFLHKPVLFYLIDLKDKMFFEEKVYMKYDKNKYIFFENAFTKQENLIKKVKDYVINDFTLKDELKKKFDSMFYYKTNNI